MTHKLNLRLAYYPPYHSKYNPIERVWGVENHWNGDILDEIETVVNFAQTMTETSCVTLVYQTGVKLKKQWLKLKPKFNGSPIQSWNFPISRLYLLEGKVISLKEVTSLFFHILNGH